MKVTIADYAGFCFGVERAIRLIDDAGKNHKNVVTFGPIIHNPQVVNDLEKTGVFVKDSLGDISSNMTAVIRTHGTEKKNMGELKKRAKLVIDATCPFVKKVQTAAQNLSEAGYPVIVVGEADHPEVQGIISFIPGEHIIVNSASDARNVPYRPKYGVVAQTTQNEKAFDEIVDILGSKCDEIKVAHTICGATQNRQAAALALASKVDVIIIVGGRNSANTTRLYQLCKEVCPRAYHIETADELNRNMFEGAGHVGISAGASTPNDIVYKVREYILENGNEQ